VFITKVKVFEKKVKYQRVKVMVSNERSRQKEYICEILKLYHSPNKVKVFQKKVKLQHQRSEGQSHGIK
jgi:ABC-type metal ion transport system substrate-binding protein